MSWLAWLLSFIFPLCGTQGAAGIAAPGIVDFNHIPLMGHSEYLTGPAGFYRIANGETPVYNMPPANLFAAVQAVGSSLPHTFPLDVEPQALQAAYVIRSPHANFPDIFEIAVIPEPGAKSGLLIYSHSLYGSSDYGKNHDHVIAWLQSLNTKVAS